MATVRKRTWTSNGRERTAWVCDYLDGTGKRRLKTFATKKAADAWSVQALHQVASGTHTPERELGHGRGGSQVMAPALRG